jgi:hypothetical protein
LKHPDIEVKRETPCTETMPSGTVKDSSSIEPPSSSSLTMSSAPPTRKRLHRSAAATVKSYAYAQSDSDDGTPTLGAMSDSGRGTRTVESNLQLWIKHLSALQKDEIKKVFDMCLSVWDIDTYLLPSSMRRNGIPNSLIFLVLNLVPSRYVNNLYTSLLPLSNLLSE